ncbi:MAG: 5-formyltetrahydrofolate cyclo-ligase [Burkholderiales bacterium]|nr:5-formyltetrahydrofolate cyclo-ligase [Burkholderiales bacterium]
MTKDQLRKVIADKCKLLGVNYRSSASLALLNHLLPLLDKATNIAIYHAHNWELDLVDLIHYCNRRDKNLVQPVASRINKYMFFAPYNITDTAIFINEEYYSKNEKYSRWYNLDLILLPVVAVDRFGFRLGKGGGYYDTTLSAKKDSSTIFCGVGYSCQYLEHEVIPYDKWDIRLDYFITDKNMMKFDTD